MGREFTSSLYHRPSPAGSPAGARGFDPPEDRGLGSGGERRPAPPVRSGSRAAHRARSQCARTPEPNVTIPIAGPIEALQADITTLDVDAIVNAANNALMPGGGVCGAIHRAAGPELAEACAEVAPCPTGEVRLTPGFGLRARWVIHAVGPVWRGGAQGEAALLASCYRAAIALASAEGFASLAFPAISTGVFGYPAEAAAAVAVGAIGEALARAPRPPRVVCACFDAATLATYRQLIERGRL
jgi:O-acetyl-ADP-ribose deacetylase (regulator of RNase III)